MEDKEINTVDSTATEEQLNIENVSDEVLLSVVLEGLSYKMVKDILIKPLEAIKIKKVINVPVGTGEKDEDGTELMEMKQEETDVDSVFRSGIILSLPSGAAFDEALKVGMKVVYPHKYSIDFDLFKDSVLVKPYDVIAIAD